MRRLSAGARDRLDRWLEQAGDPPLRARALRYAVAVGVVLAASAVLYLIRDSIEVLTVGLTYLLAILGVALLAGGGPAMAAAVLSFLSFNFVFIPPYGTFDVRDAEHLVALIAYLAVAIVIGQLLARVRARTYVAERETHRTALLYELNAALIGDATLDAVLDRVTERVVTIFGARASRVLLPDASGDLVVRAAFPGGVAVEGERQALVMAQWALEHRQPAGRSEGGRRIVAPRGQPAAGATASKDDDVLYLPIATRERTIGVLEVVGKPRGGRFSRDDEQILTSFANQAALALDRTRLAEDAARADALARSDELKSALLSAVSHDLRTPLAAIKASATALLDESVDWDAPTRREFLTAIDEETDRLTLVVSNLLDLSRIEGGALRPDRDWYDVEELVADVEARLAPRAAAHTLRSQVEPSVGLLWLDYVEIAQVLLNLGENAIKYTPPGTEINIAVHGTPDLVEFAVTDNGPGIPPEEQQRLFEKFYRADRSGSVPGTGIGLTISKGLVEAHGGRMWVESAPGEGTTFRFTIPRAKETSGAG